jgi:hypothetical protein
MAEVWLTVERAARFGSRRSKSVRIHTDLDVKHWESVGSKTNCEFYAFPYWNVNKLYLDRLHAYGTGGVS